MADHQASDNSDDPKPSGDVPAGNNPDASTDEVKALKAEMIQHRQEAARLKKENEALAASSEKPVTTPPQEPQGDRSGDRLDKLERQGQIRDLMFSESMSAKQADAVVDLMKEIPSLDAGEAKLLAAQRDQELFSDTAASSGFDASVHGTSRPTAGTAPVEQNDGPDTKERMSYIDSIRGNKREFQRMLNNHTGSIAARQVGKSGHQLHPIPES